MPLIFERSREQRRGVPLPKNRVTGKAVFDASLLRDEAASLPEVSELDAIRHYTNLSTKNFSIDSHFYPLGSCTMKYNPKVCEKASSDEGFSALHPALLANREEGLMQGSLELIHTISHYLEEITGMDEVTITPEAGAHGEMLGMMLISAYHKDRGNAHKKFVIIPDSAHGTNPATASMVDYEVVSVKTSHKGDMDLDDLRAKMSDEVAAVMLTVPNTLGLFNPHIKTVCEIAHEYDAQVYYDGANLNAILGRVKPGELGFDVVHVNLHKTFATPHGGGGPGSGPVGVKKHLACYLPGLSVIKEDNGYKLGEKKAKSIGRISPYFGNFGIVIRAYIYMRMLGKEGMLNVSEKAVLNANYLMHLLKPYYPLAYELPCMHECVFSASETAKKGVRAVDIAKFLIQKGFHAPTVYFPLVVKEALMIEPTETESKESIDAFAKAMIEACHLVESAPESFASMPDNMPVCRLDETKAAREIDICYISGSAEQ